MNKPKVITMAVALLVVGAVWQVASFADKAEIYTPGPVVVLHTWLGDQCTFVPDFDIGECCRLHDIAYQEGGTEDDRMVADVEFRDCIRGEGRPIVAAIYYSGVRLFGWLFFSYS